MLRKSASASSAFRFPAPSHPSGDDVSRSRVRRFDSPPPMATDRRSQSAMSQISLCKGISSSASKLCSDGLPRYMLRRRAESVSYRDDQDRQRTRFVCYL